MSRRHDDLMCEIAHLRMLNDELRESTPKHTKKSVKKLTKKLKRAKRKVARAEVQLKEAHDCNVELHNTIVAQSNRMIQLETGIVDIRRKAAAYDRMMDVLQRYANELGYTTHASVISAMRTCGPCDP